MAKNYSQRLTKLRDRRLGFDTGSRGMDAALMNESGITRLLKSEAYEKRTATNAIKYTLGAMQEVDPTYTRIGLDEAERVGKQLKEGLEALNTVITLDLQGSVPLNIHIRGASDVDILALHSHFLTIDRNGPRAAFYPDYSGDLTSDMVKLRNDSESILTTKFWGAKVDTTGAKSIKLSEGSLRRNIDVVPAYWHDTAAYQQSGAKHDREVKIWNKDLKQAITNAPFLHMKKITEKDVFSAGGLKKSIRLLKNMRKDAEADGKDIPLTSYDLASLMWHCDVNALLRPAVLELSILESVDIYLEGLVNNYNFATTLQTPDGSRMIFDKSEKFTALVKLSAEVSELAADVAREIDGMLIYTPNPTKDSIRKVLRGANVAA